MERLAPVRQVEGGGFRVQGLGVRVQGLGFRAESKAARSAESPRETLDSALVESTTKPPNAKEATKPNSLNTLYKHTKAPATHASLSCVLRGRRSRQRLHHERKLPQQGFKAQGRKALKPLKTPKPTSDFMWGVNDLGDCSPNP